MIRDDDETHEEHMERICASPQEIAECITFENSNTIVHHLVNTNQIAAKAVKDELDYWNEKLGSL